MTSVLWQNEEKTTILIDTPGSIAAAQGTTDEPCTHVLQSSKPLQQPFSIPAPKTAKAEANLIGGTEAHAFAESYRVVLEAALETVRSHCKGEWCVRRPFISEEGREKQEAQGEQLSSKRTLPDEGENLPRQCLPSDLFKGIVRGSLIPLECGVGSQSDSGSPEDDYDFDYNPGSHLWSYTTAPATLTITSHILTTATSLHYHFRLPENSMAFLSDCSQPRSFHELVNNRQQKFECILLDPPWPNRSVKRTKKTPGTSYSTKNWKDLDAMLCGLHVPSLLAESGYVATWITNKPAVRDLVLGPGGLFEKWDMVLVEEWIWLKTTAAGEPSSPLEDTWNGRKPYEVLLIGRRRQCGPSRLQRRVIVGVPDLHSRKPCLKGLIEELLGIEAPVLEIFARYLVSGWWSWGDECLKYNWDGYWQKAQEEEEEEAPTA